ncbi:cationic peroxidase SPC4-like [Panicum miliaceum]|uniref:Peroxidase n=1 Tax=Panicum miliaceum TaxID=4540 RepID=A0A3L6Q046_PANMI|nr:cationic peroxidase SPC4-like [Panicum miliaceum]
MKVATSTSGIVVLIGSMLLVSASAASNMPLALATDDAGLSADFHAASCPQLEIIVRAAVQAARAVNVQVTAGLLRIFFHDCLPEGCDASILLEPELSTGPNQSLQKNAVDLIEAIRAKVHAACGPTVSCADIIALATRDAVALAGGPMFAMPLGRTDSLEGADDVSMLPGPDSDVDSLLTIFNSRALSDPADLVALSGGHTVGKASCGFIRNNDQFSQSLVKQCNASPSKKQSLDTITPDVFDNKYFVALKARHGVFVSDQGLADHPRTSGLVTTFAANQTAFFAQFAKSFVKMSSIPGPAGEIRRNCFRPNNRVDMDAGSFGAVADE